MNQIKTGKRSSPTKNGLRKHHSLAALVWFDLIAGSGSAMIHNPYILVRHREKVDW
jgi:hypothetical protein